MLRDAGEVFFHHDDLRLEIQRRAEVEEVARDDHGIEVRDLGREPVELLESVMKLGDEQHFYARREALAPPLPRKHENAALVRSAAFRGRKLKPGGGAWRRGPASR